MRKPVAAILVVMILSAFASADIDWSIKHSALIAALKAEGIEDIKVLAVLNKVQRHLFVPERLREQAYNNNPLPIGLAQTISQPYIVAFMTQSLRLSGRERVLEIGTGSGYQAAVLGEIAKEVYSIEILCPLADQAKALLQKLQYKNIFIKCGDGYKGWPEKGPFDAIIVTAAPDHIPQPLIHQLAVGGRMIIPVGDMSQNLILIKKNAKGTTEKKVLPVYFVPMTGSEVEKNK
jgi:protein-L-isoaspartate(D-aspartate) O-methyltransferase